MELYNKDFRYTDIAMQLDTEAGSAIAPIFKKYFEMGISPREISHLVILAVLELELQTIL
jgi:hypothetical protein